MSHTPGPWHLSSNVFVGESPFPAVLDHLGLAVCDVIDDGKSEPETLANARLIAAAPEMYSVLKELMDLPTKSPLEMTNDQRRRLFAAFQQAHAIFDKVDTTSEFLGRHGK